MYVINKRRFEKNAEAITDKDAPFLVTQNGLVGGCMVEYSNQDKLMVIILSTKIDWVNKKAETIFIGYQYSDATKIWSNWKPMLFTNGNILLVDNSDAIDPNTLQVVEAGTPGSVPTYNFQFAIFGDPMLDSIEAQIEAKLAATLE